jgi:MFS family permease
MREIGERTKAACIPVTFPFFYGWFIVGLGFLAYLTAAGLRSAPAVLVHPLESEFGWGRTQIAAAASLNLLLLGLTAPFGDWLIDRFGPRRVILGSLGTIAVGVSATVLVSELWQLIFLWGDYQYAFLIGSCMGLIAACLALAIRRGRREAPAIPVTTEFASA